MTFFGDILLDWPMFGWGLRSFFSTALVALVVASLCLLPVKKTAQANGELWAVFGALFVMGIFGGLVGFHGGNSRVGVVGDLLPAVVTLVAGLAAYLFGVPDKKAGPLLFPLLASFVCTLFISYSIGSANRAGNEEYANWESQCLSVFGHADVLSSDIAVANAKEIFGAYCEGAFFEVEQMIE